MMTYLMTQQYKCQELFQELIERLTTREEGQDMIEYALLAALISIVAIAVILLVGPALQGMFQDVVTGVGLA